MRPSPVNRREFLQQAALASGALLAGVSCRTTAPAPRLRWMRLPRACLFTNVTADGEPFVRAASASLLDAECRLWNETSAHATSLNATQPAATHGPLRLELRHELLVTGSALGENLLAATLTLRNTSAEPQQVEVTFVTHAQPSPQTDLQPLYLPLNAAGLSGDKRFADLGVKHFLKDCHVTAGAEEFHCHYLEPLASHPAPWRQPSLADVEPGFQPGGTNAAAAKVVVQSADSNHAGGFSGRQDAALYGRPGGPPLHELTTRAMLLAPVVQLEPPGQPWRIALFTPSDEPMRFSTAIVHGLRSWRISRVVTIPPGGTHTQRTWLLVHTGDASEAWRAFHRFAHHEAHPPIGWTREFKVHYYDFLSSAQGKDGPRGDGYDADVARFKEFRVGLATQHGYYPCMGDHLHPDRPTWLAMQSDKHGAVKMSFEKIKARIKATRATGAKAGIYMHMSALDDSSEQFYPALAAGRRVDAAGAPIKFPWSGPDVKGGLWWMSMSSPEWRAHLLQQAAWIMEIFQPDAICMDETFSGLGYNYAGGQPAPLSGHAIDFFKQLHALIRSHGGERALFSSDCSMSSFCLWADGEVGDHAYGNSLGNPLYTQSPVRYLAALGDKPWRPCAWHWQGMWKHQMRLAQQVGAGVGVSNGWAEFTGLTRVDETAKAKYLADIATLF